MKIFASFLAVAMLVCVARADEPESTWEIHGQVVDESGTPVNNFEAATFWSSNGKQWDDNGEWLKSESKGAAKDKSMHEGILAANPKLLAKRLPDGRFTLPIDDVPRTTVFAVDKPHTRGGFVSVEKEAAAQPVTIKLTPLVRVHGKIFCPEAERTPKWSTATIHPPGDRQNYLHFTDCRSHRGEFSFLLPPGKYDLSVRSEKPTARMPKPGERKNKDAPADMPAYLYGVRIEVPTQPEFDIGVLNVELPKDKDGIGRDYTLFYGKEPPALSITDARGVPKDVKLADFHGKWVLLDFWALWCGPCVHRSLPELVTFCEEHAADRDRFEILAICDTEKEKALTLNEYDPLVAAIVDEAWNGKQLPFPVLLDGEGRTNGVYGIQSLPTVLLIDPAGHLVEDGDESTLAEELAKLNK